MEREVGGGIGMGNTCKPMAVSFQRMTKSTTKKKKKRNAGLDEAQAGIKIPGRDINNLKDMQMTPPLWQKEKKN